jgi:hypothetical protein
MAVAECKSANSPTAPGKHRSSWAVSWLHSATRAFCRSLRVRDRARRTWVASLSGRCGRRRWPSVRSTSANSSASAASDLAPAAP